MKTRYKLIRDQLKKNGAEVTLKREYHHTPKASEEFTNFYVAEIYFDGETGLAYDDKGYFKALQKAQFKCATKFPTDQREPLLTGMNCNGIPSSKRRSRI